MEHREDTTKQAIQRMNKYLELHSHRKTPEREEVLRAVCGMNCIFTLDDLATNMSETSSFIVSRGTLFQTLNLLEKIGIVVKHLVGHCAHYEFITLRKSKVYFFCDNCGKMEAFHKAEINQYLDAIRSCKFTVKQPVLYLHGLCKRCERIVKEENNKKSNK